MGLWAWLLRHIREVPADDPNFEGDHPVPPPMPLDPFADHPMHCKCYHHR